MFASIVGAPLEQLRVHDLSVDITCLPALWGPGGAVGVHDLSVDITCLPALWGPRWSS